MIDAPDASTITGKRDRALFAVLIGCGLRRSESAALTFEHIQQREGRWLIVDLVGKHGRIRSVPMPAFAKIGMDQWSAASGIYSGRVFRPGERPFVHFTKRYDRDSRPSLLGRGPMPFRVTAEARQALRTLR